MASPISHMVLDRLSVFFHITATRILAALSTFQIVGGVKGPACGARIMSLDFLEPLLIPNRLDSFQVVPKLDPMRHRRLKFL